MYNSCRCNETTKFRRVRKYLLLYIIYLLYIFRTLKWKNAVDDAVTFYDDGKLPAVLVQNKVDLLPEEEQDNIEELKKFSEDNGFNGYFRASAKSGKNIKESMEFLIKEIIKRLEEINSKGNADFNKDRGSVALDPDKHNKEADMKRKKQNSGCC